MSEKIIIEKRIATLQLQLDMLNIESDKLNDDDKHCVTCMNNEIEMLSNSIGYLNQRLKIA